MSTSSFPARLVRTGLLSAGVWLGALAPAAEIVLPIEVLSATVPATRTVAVSTSAAASTLSLRIHGLAHANLAEVRLDERAWIPLNDETATVAGLARRFGGIGGSFATLDLRVPLTPALAAGTHTLAFRFAQGDGVTIGFRVLRLDLLDAAGGSALVGTTFRNDDPAGWTPPLGGAAAAGEALWRTAELREGIGQPIIRARCGDCHAQDGRDLAYFNYSNHAIIERSRFHGLSQSQGEQIASYIRSLPRSTHGRPWNPPYQPGPGLTARPVSEWSAGAGIDAIPMEDAEAISRIPGASGDAREIIDEDGRIRDVPTHDLPKAFQLLDWNHWLPRVHPLDVPGHDFDASAAKAEYLRLRGVLSGPDADSAFHRSFLSAQGNGPGSSHFFDRLRDEAIAMKYAVVPGHDGRTIPAHEASRVYSAALWASVKLWELMQEFQLEGRGKEVYGAIGPQRLWYSHRFVFDFSPFLSGLLDDVVLFGDGPAAINHDYINNAWYELQLQLNAGAGGRSSGGHGTIDWGYMANHFGGMLRVTGEPEPVRRSVFALTSMQQHDAGTGPEFSGDGNPDGGGWDFVTALTALHDLSPDYWRRVADPKPLIQAMLQALAEKCARFTPAQWRRAAGHDGFNMPTPDYVMGTDQGEARERNQAEWYHVALIDARDHHRIDEPVVNGLAAVGALIWERNDWAAHRRATAAIPAPASCSATTGQGSIQVAWSPVPGATSYNLYRAVSASGPFAPLTLMTTATTVVDRRLTPGTTWFYRVSANVGGREGAGGSPVASAGVGRGLLGRWGFDETGPRVLDASGQRNHGELVGAVERVPGRRGGALRLSGRGQFASVPHDLLPALRDGTTVAMWVRSSATLRDGEIMCPLGGQRYFALVERDGRPRVKVWDGEVVAGTPILDGQWHHLAMTHSTAHDIRIWIDGVLAGSGTFAAHPEDNVEIHDLGRAARLNHTDTTWLGDLDDLRIYDEVLGESEIRAIMDDTSTGPASDPDGDFRPGTPAPPTANPPGGGGSGGGGIAAGAGGGGGGGGCGLGSSLTILVAALALGLGRRRRAG